MVMLPVFSFLAYRKYQQIIQQESGVQSQEK